MKILVTGAAGFIGSSLVDRLLESGFAVVGVDNFNSYYDVQIKKRNIKAAIENENFKFYECDILDFNSLEKIFRAGKFNKVVHLAARAGVRPSIENPELYCKVNVLGTVNLLKLCVDFNVKKFVFASSSSVYGQSDKIPFEEEDNCQSIISPYGASKRAAEFWVESFYKSYGLPCAILRFFTVYGPRGRPDMAPALFTESLLADKVIYQFGDGESMRDYTYVNDIVDGVVKTMDKKISFEIINLGNNRPIELAKFIKLLEITVNKKAKIKKVAKQHGDVEKTWASVVKAKELLGWQPGTNLQSGLKKYVEWLQSER